MLQVTLPSPGKINLFLKVLGKRSDGFHEIMTGMCRIDLSDTVDIQQLNEDLPTRITCDDPSVPTDETNLAMRALRLFEQETQLRQPWLIRLEKRIPSGAGLGGGSSNAAAVLRGLNQLLGFPLRNEELLSLAGQIGSDVPFFMLEGAAANCSGRGEIVAAWHFPWHLPLVIIKPAFPIPTPWAYQRWAASRERPGVLYAPQICPWGTMVNDLERPVFEKHVLLPTLKSKLLEHRETVAALMSGSGSTIFAITQSAASADELASLTREWCGPTSFVKVTHTIPSST